jgi:mevalonate kinase
MIELFNNKMNDKDFSNFFNKSYINTTNECITNLLNSSNYYRDSIKKLSEITYKNMNEMIPDSLNEIWNEGLKSDSFYMKLCGSGGGGFFLVFDFENEIKGKLDKFKLFEV